MGLFKKSKLKSNEPPKLMCKSGDVGSYKCVFLASYRQVPIDVKWEESSVLDDKMSESLHLPGINRFPCIDDGDFTVCGSNAVLTYLNIKGKAPTIHPRKARVLAAQQYWIQVLTRKFEPQLCDISKNQKQLTSVLKVLDKTLADNKNNIVGELSLADIHWSAVFKVLEEEGNTVIFDSYSNVCSWLTKMKSEIPAYDTKVEKVAA